MAKERGPEALRSRPRPGAPAKLTPDQKHLIADFLWHGAEAYGFRGDVWTCARLAQVLEQEFGVSYHPHHVSKLLKQLDWTPQVPITRAIQRDKIAIAQWQQKTWPRLLSKARKEGRVVIFEDESGFYLLPGIVRTYAPKGMTPIVYEWQTRDHLSVMGGITCDGKVFTLRVKSR
jgi:transposase